MNLGERLIYSATKNVPVDEFLRIRFRQKGVSPEESDQLSAGARRIGIDLETNLKFTLHPAVVLSRILLRNVTLKSYICSRVKATKKAIDASGRLIQIYEEGLWANTAEQDKAFFRGEASGDDLRITEFVADAARF